jgi:hypothetical protein
MNQTICYGNHKFVDFLETYNGNIHHKIQLMTIDELNSKKYLKMM